MPRVVHFEIHADNPERAINFYQNAFGWEIEKWQGDYQDYWLVMTGSEDEPGIDGGIMRRQGKGPSGPVPVTSYVCTVDVPNLDEYLEKVSESGGTVAVPKMPVPGVGWLAYAHDTEGNIFGMMESDESAT